MFQFNHFNFNVLDLEKSLKFYKEALGLDVVREKDSSDGSFKIVYLGDHSSDFLLELTWMRDQKEPYNLGDEEFHLALTADDFDKAHEDHVPCQNHLQSKPDETLHPQDYKAPFDHASK